MLQNVAGLSSRAIGFPRRGEGGWWTLEPFDVRILQVVRELKQDQCAKIYPKFVQARLNNAVSERQVRRRMADLSGAGYLERVGQRNGYRPAWVN